MKRIILPLISLLFVFSSISYGQSKEEILSEYQKRGLKFVYIKGVPDQLVGARMVKEIYGRLDIPVELLDRPGKRALEEASTGVVDGESIRIEKIGEIFPSLLRVSPPISKIEASVFTKGLDIPVSGWDSIKDHKVGVVRGIQYVADGTKDMKAVTAVNNERALIEVLDKGRVDLIVTARYNGLYQLKSLGYGETIKPLSPSVTELLLFNYLHEKHKKLVPIVEELITELNDSGELAKIREKYQEEVLSITEKNIR